ncbi:MAG: DNA-protecting protein DprA [Clostridiales bacterium]|nr:DNA-protecting protein DprA [Clostridiales bacterium]
MVDKKYCVWLSGLPGIGSRSYTRLVSYFGNAKRLFHCSENELIDSKLINEKTAKLIMEKRDITKLDRYMNTLKKNDITVYTIDDEEYPFNLKNIFDPPSVLYVKGNIIENDINSIAIVGSRKASEYGLKTAYQFGKELAESGFTVVSGMALGIDSAAHKGALKAGGRTIAVFGCGLNSVYPKSGLNLAMEITKNGAIISEYPLGYKALPQNFPARNRIISGMSKGVLIVEANKKSGSLITADFALEQGRDVFAIPGNINSPNSLGTNELIKNGAQVVVTAADILEEYYGYADPLPHKEVKNPNAIEKIIMDSVKESGMTADNIIEKNPDIQPSEILSTIILMEIQGYLKQIEGVYYNA